MAPELYSDPMTSGPAGRHLRARHHLLRAAHPEAAGPALADAVADQPEPAARHRRHLRSHDARLAQRALRDGRRHPRRHRQARGHGQPARLGRTRCSSATARCRRSSSGRAPRSRSSARRSTATARTATRRARRTGRTRSSSAATRRSSARAAATAAFGLHAHSSGYLAARLTRRGRSRASSRQAEVGGEEAEISVL